MKKVAFYCQDARDSENSADHQWERLQAATQGEATGETPPFDEILVTEVGFLGDREEEVQKRLAELGEKGVRVRVVDGSQDLST